MAAIAAGEFPVEPAMPICDAHHHLWQRAGERYLLENLLDDIAGGHNVVATVAVECKAMYRTEGREDLKPIGETEFLEGVAKEAVANPGIGTAVGAAIVGFADLTLGDGVAAVLEAHLAASPRRFRGIRYSTTYDPSGALRNDSSRNMMSETAFRRGFRLLKRFNLSFDAWLYHPQLLELAALAHAFPDVVIILDHIGGPLGTGPYAGRRDEVFDAWHREIGKVAECPNVMVKLGGLGSERSGFHWHQRSAPPLAEEIAAAIKPYFEFCIEKFGASRCMFESNFPVEKRANTYLALWNAFKLMTASFSPGERAALFHDTAFRVYRLAPE
ncbi:MAG: amidohydrolase family protein, partial [Deltaproteobacteria bacterium]|nr:amidohydrolase family protein [Deltaproteobacteria bacterium]